MRLIDLLNQTHEGPVKALVTATNGLAPKDALLCAALLQVYPEKGSDVEYFYIKRTADEVAKSQEHHKVSFDTISRLGVPCSEIKPKFESAVKDCTILTYNPGFQIGFIGQILNAPECVQLYDWTCIEKSLRNKRIYTEEECENIRTFAESCATHFDPVPVSRYGVKHPMAPGESRMDYMLSISREVLYEVLFREFELLQH